MLDYEEGTQFDSTYVSIVFFVVAMTTDMSPSPTRHYY